MSNTLLVNMTVNDDLIYITNLYCEYVNYLMDLLKPSDWETIILFSEPFSKSKPKIDYVLKPLRQNAQLPRQFSRLAERRSLTLLRSFCRKIRKMFVKYDEEVREFQGNSTPAFSNRIDLNDKVSKIEGKIMQIFFNDRVIESELEISLPSMSKALHLDLSRKGALVLVPSIRYASGTQSGNKFTGPITPVR